MNLKEDSPFTPGSPVPPGLFVGRTSQIQNLLQYIERSSHGKQENIFLSGDRGIGKSSLASYISYLVRAQKDFLSLHTFLGRVSTLEEMIRHIFDQLLKETKKESWYQEIAGFFGKHIKEIGLFGISVSFAPPERELTELVRNFPEALNNILNKIQPHKRGLFIALDDVNGIVDRTEFANWYKSFVDEVATQYIPFPVCIMLIGLHEKRDILSKKQPSLMRIFRVTDIEKLSDEEVEEFLQRAFDEVQIRIVPDALDIMVKYSSGLPILMQEIGDAIFWSDRDGVIDIGDAFSGLFTAAENVGKKYLDPKVYRAIRSENYRSILRRLGDSLERRFIKRDVERKLDESERRVFHNFLTRMRKLGVIETDVERGRGAYKFTNEIYPIYVWMEKKRVVKQARK